MTRRDRMLDLDFGRPLVGGFTPRAYQIAARDAVMADFASGISRCVVSKPTGTGKTETAFLIGQQFERRLFAFPNIELVTQTLERARKRWPDASVDLEQGFNRAAGDSDTICATIQSLMSRGRYKKFLGKVDLLVIDECHWGFTNTQHKIIMEFVESGTKVVGLSATPYVKGGILSFWEKLSFQYSIRDATEDGYLVPCEITQLRCKEMDLSAFKLKGSSDYNGIELDSILMREKVALEFCEGVARYYNGQCSIGFCHSIGQAEQMREILTARYGIKTAIVHSKMPPEDRDANMQSFFSGESPVILNVGVLILGFDWPGVRNVFSFKPTASIARYIQVCGRGTRPEPGVIDNPVLDASGRRAAIAASSKPTFNMFDFTDNCRTHSLMTSVDMYAPEATAEVKEQVQRRIEGKKVTVPQIDEIVKEEMEEERKRLAFVHRMEEMRRAKLKARAEFSETKRDPYAPPDYAREARKRQAYMPFGKHKGKPISAVPTEYLEWYRGEGRKGWVLDAVVEELGRRVQERRARAQAAIQRRDQPQQGSSHPSAEIARHRGSAAPVPDDFPF